MATHTLVYLIFVLSSLQLDSFYLLFIRHIQTDCYKYPSSSAVTSLHLDLLILLILQNMPVFIYRDLMSIYKDVSLQSGILIMHLTDALVSDCEVLYVMSSCYNIKQNFKWQKPLFQNLCGVLKFDICHDKCS